MLLQSFGRKGGDALSLGFDLTADRVETEASHGIPCEIKAGGLLIVFVFSTWGSVLLRV